MKSLKARFNGQTSEVVEYARNFGIFQTMEQYHVKDYAAMFHFLEEVAPGQHFQTAKMEISPLSQPDAFDKLLQAMLRKYETLNNLVKDKDSQITRMKQQLDYYKANRWQETSGTVQAILKECHES